MKKFLIKCDTNWPDSDAVYGAEAESEEKLYGIAYVLAYENFHRYDRWVDIAIEEGYDPDEMTSDNWDELEHNVDESKYFSWVVVPFEGDDEEWKSYSNIEKL